MPFHAYLLLCNDGTFYAGHRDNLELRMAQHESGAMGGYTAQRLPLTLVWSGDFETREEALAAEAKSRAGAAPRNRRSSTAIGT